MKKGFKFKKEPCQYCGREIGRNMLYRHVRKCRPVVVQREGDLERGSETDTVDDDEIMALSLIQARIALVSIKHGKSLRDAIDIALSYEEIER